MKKVKKFIKKNFVFMLAITCMVEGGLYAHAAEAAEIENQYQIPARVTNVTTFGDEYQVAIETTNGHVYWFFCDSLKGAQSEMWINVTLDSMGTEDPEDDWYVTFDVIDCWN